MHVFDGYYDFFQFGCPLFATSSVNCAMKNICKRKQLKLRYECENQTIKRKLRVSDKRILWCHSNINSISIELLNWILVPIFQSYVSPILFLLLPYSFVCSHSEQCLYKCENGEKNHHNSNLFQHKSLNSFWEFFGKSFFFAASHSMKWKSETVTLPATELIYQEKEEKKTTNIK